MSAGRIRAWVTVHEHHTIVRLTFDRLAIEEIKHKVPLSARTWNGTDKTWKIRQPYGDRVIDLLCRRYGDDGVDVVDPAHPDAHLPMAGIDDDWAAALFGRLPDRLREPVFKSLISVIHPDHGGDGRLAQQLNDAFRGAQR